MKNEANDESWTLMIDYQVQNLTPIQKLLGLVSGSTLRKIFTISPLTNENIYRVYEKCLTIESNIAENPDPSRLIWDMNTLPKILYVVAAIIQNNEHEPEQELIDFLQWNCTAEDLLRVYVLARKQVDNFFKS